MSWIKDLAEAERLRRSEITTFEKAIPAFIETYANALRVLVDEYRKEFPDDQILLSASTTEITISSSAYSVASTVHVTFDPVAKRMVCSYSGTYETVWKETLHVSRGSLVWGEGFDPREPHPKLVTRILSPVLFPGLGKNPFYSGVLKK